MRKLLVGLVGLVFLIIAAAILIPLVIPVTTYEGRLITLVKRATGRDLKIAGPVKLSLFPALELEASDVSLSNPPDARSPNMVKLKQLQMRLRILPLLHGSVVVSRLVLLQAVIALEMDKAGRPNWEFGTPATPAAAAPPRTTAAPARRDTGGGLSINGLGISGVTFEEVRFVDGAISYNDQRTDKTERLDKINSAFSLRSLANPLAANGSAVWRGESVTFALRIDQPSALVGGAESEANLKLAAALMTLDFSGRVEGPPSARLAGLVDLRTQSVRQLAQWMGSPITFSGGGFGPFAIKGRLATAGTKISISDADLSLDTINAKGSIAIDHAGARPVVTGKFAVDRLDLTAYLSPETTSTPRPAAPGGSAPAPTSAAQSDGNDLAIDASPLELADIDVDLNIGSIAYRRFQIETSTVAIRVKDDQFTADLSRMSLYRGSGHGTVTVDGSGAAPSVGLNIALAQVQIDPLAQALIGDSRLTGTGNLDIAVTARGRSQRELINTLSGRAALSLANGQIEGVNLPALAASAAKIERDIIRTLDITDTLNLLAHGQISKVGPLALVENAAKSLVGGGNNSSFATLTATGTFTNGLVRNNDLQVRLGGAPMTGAGTVDLRTSVVDYRVNVRLGEGVIVPVQVSGTWDNLSYRPDVAAMLMQTPRNVLDSLKSAGGSVGKGLEGVGQGLYGVGQGAVGVLKGIFGK
ncbi:MAG: AsmA family protein [Stellaceae bacterium]